MKILNIIDKPKCISEVIKLGDQNSNSLGFLPKVAFSEFARKGNILIAIDDDEKFLGYLLFNRSKRNGCTSITHLCVKESQRGRGIGKELVEKLKQISKRNSLGIRVHCRRDWEAHGFWPKMGFVAREEKDGRSKDGSTLTVYWYDHGQPDLFSYLFDETFDDKVHVAIDANILYDLQDENSRNKDDSPALLADWLEDEIELCVTQEIYNEIDRNDDPNLREESRRFASAFKNIPFREVPDQAKQKLIDELFLNAKSAQDESDKRQIERAVGAGIEYFITHDENLLKKKDEFKSRIGISIWTPSELIIHLDSLNRKGIYYPSRLAGTNLEFSRIKSDQINKVIDTFLWPTDESKSKFSSQLNKFAAYPQHYEIMVIKDSYKFLGLIVYGQENNGFLDIPIMRINRTQLLPPLFEFLIMRSIQKASLLLDSFSLIRISERYFLPESTKILQRHGFHKVNDYYWRLSEHGVFRYEDFSNKVESLSENFPQASTYLEKVNNLIDYARTNQYQALCSNLEKILWPVKFLNVNLNNFIVPIQPHWAIDLFDSNLGKQDLFGGKPQLVLLSENAYYRSARSKILESPGRILWYVSSSKKPYRNVKSIRACSQINEVLIDKPKVLLHKFRQMGVFEWPQVYEIAKRDLKKEIMAFRFSHTELFESSISLNELRRIWEEDKDKNFHLQAPIRITNDQFIKLYKLGMNIQEEENNG